MTTTVSRQPPTRGRLPVRSRGRSPALAALALLLIVGGGLGAALIVYRTGQQTDVLVAAHELKPGEQVNSDDFSTVRISGAGGAVIPSSAERNFVGSFATTGIPSGALLNAQMFQSKEVLPAGGVVVGVNLTADQRPASGISTGDVVRAYYVNTSSSGGQIQDGKSLADAVRVVSVNNSQASTGTVTVSLLVDSSAAPALIAAAATNNVALAALPVGTQPSLDFVQSK